jgi:transglutaminase-like putative cysteine protease
MMPEAGIRERSFIRARDLMFRGARSWRNNAISQTEGFMKRINLMISGILFFALVLLIITVIPSEVGANEAKSGTVAGNTKYVKYYANYDVNANGTHTVTYDIIVEVLTEEGVKSANQVTFSYSESLENPTILSAYTLKKDGRRIDVPPSNIQERSAVTGGGPMFSDIKTKVIIFPDLTVGDKASYSYKINQKTALFPGQFSMTETFTQFMAYDDVRISVTVPGNSLSLQCFARGVQGGRVEDKDGRIRWVWTYNNHNIATPEIGSVSEIDYGPLIVVSSFKNYGEVAEAYEERAKPKASVSDKIRRLADELTQGIAGEREQAKILYTWVSQNIHYAGNCIGTGSVVPHDADMVLDNRLGDCKDHTALLQALLAAKGIVSTPVLINSGSSYKLPDVPSVDVLNHVINYIPSLDLYADSTAEYIPFGLLPSRESGKLAVHTANFAGLRQTPPTDYKTNTLHLQMVLHVHEDGSADGETNNDETGFSASAVRALMSYIEPNMEDLVVRSILARSGFTGMGTLIKGHPRDVSEHYTYGIKYHLENVMNVPGPGAISVVDVFSSSLSIRSAVGELNTPKRTLSYPCVGGISTEEYTLELPSTIKIIAMPKDIHLAGSSITYDSTYIRKNNVVTVTRKLEDRTPGNLCTPEDDARFRSIAGSIIKDLKSQIIYQPADGEEK